MKGLRVIKIVKEINFEGVLGKLESKKRFIETTSHKITETKTSLHVK